jgi:putative transcriptional regulator
MPLQQMIIIRLNEILKEKDVSLYQLAQDSGVSYGSLYKLAKRKTQSSISLPMLSKICAVLGCTPGDLLTLQEDDETRALKALVKAKRRK